MFVPTVDSSAEYCEVIGVKCGLLYFIFHLHRSVSASIAVPFIEPQQAVNSVTMAASPDTLITSSDDQ